MFLLVLFSIFGIGTFIAKKANIRLEFGLTIATALIVSVLYLFSLIKLLLPITILIFILGIILGIAYIIKKDFSLVKESYVSLIFASIIFGFLFIALSNIKPLSFDNFSHWLLISKQTLDFNNLPDATNILTSYFEYPPGSTYFIYYCSLFLGNSEFSMIFSQAIFEILLLLPLFTFVYGKGKKILNLIVLCFIIFCLVIDISVADLLVDSLLGIAALSCFMFLYSYKADLRKTLLFLIPLNLMLLLIKNSAIFFFAIEILYILYLLFKEKNNWKHNVLNFIIAIVPFVLFMLWKIRCKIVFNDLDISAAQSVSLSSYKSNLALKTLADIKDIILNFLSNLFDLNNLYTLIIFGLIVGIIIFYFVNKKNSKNIIPFKSILLFIFIILFIYFAYAFSLLFAYIVSMTLDEALRLASFERYIYSVIIFILGFVLVIYFSKVTESKGLNYLIVIILSLMIVFSKNSLNLIGIQDYKNSNRYKIEKIVDDLPKSNGKNILVISSVTKVDGYVRFLFTYLLNSNEYTLIQDTNTLDEIDINKYDYVITTDKDKNVAEFLSEKTNYKGKLGWYKVE